MYLNSNLRSRYSESANYKCFADVFEGGSVIHDIWEEHFECDSGLVIMTETQTIQMV